MSQESAITDIQRKKSNNGTRRKESTSVIVNTVERLKDYPIRINGYKAERLELCILAFRMKGKGLTFREISQKLGIGLSTAHKYYGIAEKHFLELAKETYESRLSKVYGDIDTLLNECYALYDRSIGEVETITEKRTIASRANKAKGIKAGDTITEVTVKREIKAGDPRPLQIIQNLIGEKVKVLNLEKNEEAGKGLAAFLARGFHNIEKERFLKYKADQLPKN